MEKDKANVILLYTSDVHGQATPIFYGSNEAADIGLAKYATAVGQVREENEAIIVVDNGDLIQGTPLMTHYVKEHADKENPMVGVINRIGLDAAVIGNHEFNFGRDILADAVNQSAFPWLSANCLDKRTGKPYFGPPYIMKVLDQGVKIAIVGVTTHYIPNWEATEHIRDMAFADAFSTLQTWVRKIRETEKPDILIAMYHGGFERDVHTGEPTEPLTGENQGYKMCTEIEGIDVLLTGHQHRQLAGKINDVLIIQPGHDGEAYGEVHIDMQFASGKWMITDKRAQVKTLEGVQADPGILAYTNELETSTQEWLDQPTGFIDGDMSVKDPFRVRLSKHPFIEFIHKVQMEAGHTDISVTSLLNDNAKGFSGTVTMRDIVSNYIYPNTLVVLELTGEDIISALEKSAAYFVLNEQGQITVNPAYAEPKPQHYNYDMWEGIDYTINVAHPAGERVENITYHGYPIDINKSYHVVLNNYRASGGGNFDMFKGKPVIREIQKDIVELIREYFEKHKTVKATLSKNFIIKAE
ncbi:bifunctional metallophosphatase/5'-nucleotidase [Virgibacillus kimchii]